MKIKIIQNGLPIEIESDSAEDVFSLLGRFTGVVTNTPPQKTASVQNTPVQRTPSAKRIPRHSYCQWKKEDIKLVADTIAENNYLIKGCSARVYMALRRNGVDRHRDLNNVTGFTGTMLRYLCGKNSKVAGTTIEILKEYGYQPDPSRWTEENENLSTSRGERFHKKKSTEEERPVGLLEMTMREKALAEA